MDLMDDGSNVSSQRDGRFKVVPLDAVGKVEENRGSAPTALMKNVGVVNPSLTRILLKIMLHRTLILVPLMTLVLVTNSSIWASSTTGSIFLFQTMIAVIGIITALLLYECSWMMQGAVAVLWTWRRRGQRKRRRRDEYLPLIVGESIQTGRPSSLFGKGASLQDVCVVMFVPICVGMVEATYKFGVSIKDNASTRRSTVMTTFLSRGIERIPAIVEGCERTDNVCNWNYLQQRYGLVPSSIDPVDYSWASGVVMGKNITSTSYRLIAGDVPAIDEVTRSLVSGGIRYAQHLIDITVTCNASSSNPYTTPCTDIPSTTPSIPLFSACLTGPIITGVITFLNSSIGLSCGFNLTAGLRNVTAVPVGAKWDAERTVKTGRSVTPLSLGVWANITEPWKQAVVTDIEKSIDSQSLIGPCLYGCKRLNSTFRYSVAARLSVTLSEHLFFTSMSSNHVKEPLPGTSLIAKDKFIEIYTPGGLTRIDFLSSQLTMYGKSADLDIVTNSYVVVSYWILMFALLPVVEGLAALVKWRYACHPLDAICGVLWTLAVVQEEKGGVGEKGNEDDEEGVREKVLRLPGRHPTLA